ncbi:MAG: hypothetical protein GY696_37525 [Gammaproteobacteria bacterium]|nr:hypothetical protein [Gammaproteobacteria bacterium]
MYRKRRKEVVRTKPEKRCPKRSPEKSKWEHRLVDGTLWNRRHRPAAMEPKLGFSLNPNAATRRSRKGRSPKKRKKLHPGESDAWIKDSFPEKIQTPCDKSCCMVTAFTPGGVMLCPP